MKPRHQARAVALQILYRYETPSLERPSAQPEQLIRELGSHFDHFQVPQEYREFAGQLVAGTLRERESLDEILETHA